MAHNDSDSNKKEEKLYNFLCKAMDDYDKGERKNLNLIQDDVCQKTKDISVLKMWMNCFMKKVFSQQQTQQYQQNCSQQAQKNYEQQNKFLIELVLFKMPFLDIENGENNHSEILPILEKFILQLISQKQNSYIQTIISHLVENLIPQQFNELQVLGLVNEQTVKICDQSFEGKQQVITKVKQILQKYFVANVNQKQQLKEEDLKFMIEIFKAHPKSAKKLYNLQTICVGSQIFSGRTQQLFFIQKKDGSREDISYIKSVANLFELNYVKNKLTFKKDRQQKVNEFLIQLLCKILRIYPLQQKVFLQTVKEKYPHKIQNEECHKIYLISLLKITQQIPNLFAQISKIVIEKLIEIDAEIKLDVHLMETNNLTTQEKQQMVDSMARKLDWMMLIFFEFIEEQFNTNNNTSKQQQQNQQQQQSNDVTSTKSIQYSGIFKQNQQQQQNNKKSSQIKQKQISQALLQKQYSAFLDIFQKDILVTHECKFVQFLMFVLCKINQEYCEEFMSVLIKNIIIKTNTLYLQTKINSTFYLMSFIARASYVNGETIWKSLEMIMQYVRDYLSSNEERQKWKVEKEDLLKEHQMLYYNIQMILYIILYRHNHLKKTQLTSLFKFLEQTIVKSFSSMNFIQVQVLYQFSVLLEEEYPEQQTLLEIFQSHQEQNPNMYKNQKYSHNESINLKLDLYYPFDPYLLQYSEKYLKGSYLFWEDVQELNKNLGSRNIQQEEQQQVNVQAIQSSNNCSTTHSDRSEQFKDINEFDDAQEQIQSESIQHQQDEQVKQNTLKNSKLLNNSQNNKKVLIKQKKSSFALSQASEISQFSQLNHSNSKKQHKKNSKKFSQDSNLSNSNLNSNNNNYSRKSSQLSAFSISNGKRKQSQMSDSQQQYNNDVEKQFKQSKKMKKQQQQQLKRNI